MFLPLLALSGRAVERAQTVFYCELFVWLIRTIRNGSCNVLYATTYACFGCHPLLYRHTFCGIATRVVAPIQARSFSNPATSPLSCWRRLRSEEHTSELQTR